MGKEKGPWLRPLYTITLVHDTVINVAPTAPVRYVLNGHKIAFKFTMGSRLYTGESREEVYIEVIP